LNIPKHNSRPHPATIKTTQSLVNAFNQSKKQNDSIDILLKIFKIDPPTATLTKAKTGQKAIGIAADDMYAILSREKLIDLTALEFSQKRSYQKQKAKEIEENKTNESIILESQTTEIVTDEDDETSSEGNIEESEEFGR
jgi:hypothetical protein